MLTNSGAAIAGPQPISEFVRRGINDEGHQFVGEQERCQHCGLFISYFIESEVQRSCVPAWLRQQKQLDESDNFVTYQVGAYSAKFFAVEMDAKKFLRSDSGFGFTYWDNSWRGPIPVRSVQESEGFDWSTFDGFLHPDDITSDHDLNLEQLLDITLNGQDPEATCMLRLPRDLTDRANRRLGHQYHGRLILNPASILADMWRDLLSEFRRTFPAADAVSIADFMTSVNVFRHLWERADELSRDRGFADRLNGNVTSISFH